MSVLSPPHGGTPASDTSRPECRRGPRSRAPHPRPPALPSPAMRLSPPCRPRAPLRFRLHTVVPLRLRVAPPHRRVQATSARAAPPPAGTSASDVSRPDTSRLERRSRIELLIPIPELPATGPCSHRLHADWRRSPARPRRTREAAVPAATRTGRLRPTRTRRVRPVACA